MQIEVGGIVTGTVSGIAGFGAFVSLGNGKTGLVHISEVALEYVSDIKSHLKEGQEVKVKVVSVDKDGKISLSIKKALEAERKTPVAGGATASRKPANRKPAEYDASWLKKGSSAMTFEDKMSKFKQDSDEKMQALKRNTEGKRGSGGYRRAY